MDKSHLLLPLCQPAKKIVAKKALSKRQQRRLARIEQAIKKANLDVNGELKFLMWEQAPCTRSVILEYKSKTYTLKFPYLIFVLRNYDGYDLQRVLLCGASPKPIKSLDDPIYFPPLSNIYEGLNVCLPGVSGNLLEAVQQFWDTAFYEGHGWLGDFIRHKVSGLGSYKEWEQISKECPDLLEAIEWTDLYWGSLKDMASMDFRCASVFTDKMHRLQQKLSWGEHAWDEE